MACWTCRHWRGPVLTQPDPAIYAPCRLFPDVWRPDKREPGGQVLQAYTMSSTYHCKDWNR